MSRFTIVLVYAAVALIASVSPAAAQFVGTFTWQTQPYCNRVTVNVTQAGDAYILEGYDDLCGAERRAPVTGTATLNPNGSVGLGLVIVGVPGGEPTHIDAVVDIATLGGPWSDSHGSSGTFLFNGAGGGNRRPADQATLTAFGTVPIFVGRRAAGTATNPLPVISGNTLAFFGGRGHDGTSFEIVTNAAISLVTTEAWTPTAHGARIDFITTANGTTTPNQRMRIDHDGQVGIGNIDPLDRLDVFGNVRIGTSGANGCLRQRDATFLIGTCVSDARFKRDVTAFAPMLDKVAALRPVHFYWRAEEFPSQGFGATQSYGLMAQEVEEVLPELVTTDAEGYKAVNYSKLPLIAIQAIKELKAKLEAQSAEFDRRLAELEARLKQ